MSEIKLLSVFVENKIGTFSKVIETLAEKQLSVRWFKIIDGSENQFGVMRLLVDNPEDAVEILKRNKLMVSTVNAVTVEIEDKVGALAQIASTLKTNGISVRNGSGYVLNGKTYLLLELDEQAKAITILKENGYRI